jgi:hypothetical protein
VQAYTDERGHTAQSAPELAAALRSALQWIDKGTKPAPQSILAMCEQLRPTLSRPCRYHPEFELKAHNTRYARGASGATCLRGSSWCSWTPPACTSRPLAATAYHSVGGEVEASIFGFCATDKAYGAPHLGNPCGKVGVLAFAHGPSAPIAQRPGQVHNRANSSATTRADESEMPLHSRHAGRIRRRPQQLD